MKVVIIGGVAGGASSAARLRRLDETAEIIMLEKGSYISYANCGLPYYIGDVIKDRNDLILNTPEGLKTRFNIDVRVNSEVVSIDKSNKLVTVNQLNGETYQESYDKLVIATGAKPIRPNIKGIDLDGIFTLRNVTDTDIIKEYITVNKPKTVAVIGGGYIGIEMAENLKHLGLEATIIEMADQLISSLDYDMAQYLHSYIKKVGINLMLNNKVAEFVKSDKGITVFTDKGEIKADLIILSLGVIPDTLIAKNAGLKLNERGAIITNNKLLTSDKDIYAAGDAVEIENFVTKQRGYIPLAGPANKQGRIVANNIAGIESEYNGSQGSAIIKVFDLTVAVTGINEKMAIDEGLDYGVVINPSEPHATYYPGGVEMTIKTVYENKTGRILGAQIVGYNGVDKRCDVFATAIRQNLTASDLIELELCYAPPFSSAKDPVNMVGYIIENIISGKVKQFYINDIDNILKNENSILLDVRTAYEFSRSSIKGSINIPIDSLRDNLDKLDKTKNIYVFCRSGVRSYLANRQLMQYGFNSYNLAGGYTHYRRVKNI